MDTHLFLIGSLVIVMGLLYFFFPEKVFKYDQWVFLGSNRKLTSEWIKVAKVRGISFIILGVIVIFLEKLIFMF